MLNLQPNHTPNKTIEFPSISSADSPEKALKSFLDDFFGSGSADFFTKTFGRIAEIEEDLERLMKKYPKEADVLWAKLGLFEATTEHMISTYPLWRSHVDELLARLVEYRKSTYLASKLNEYTDAELMSHIMDFMKECSMATPLTSRGARIYWIALKQVRPDIYEKLMREFETGDPFGVDRDARNTQEEIENLKQYLRKHLPKLKRKQPEPERYRVIRYYMAKFDLERPGVYQPKGYVLPTGYIPSREDSIKYHYGRYLPVESEFNIGDTVKLASGFVGMVKRIRQDGTVGVLTAEHTYREVTPHNLSKIAFNRVKWEDGKYKEIEPPTPTKQLALF